MESVTAIFAIAGTVVILGFIGEWIFAKTRVPDPLWLMLFGVLLGYFTQVTPTFLEIGQVFTTFVLIFLLFEGVLNTNLRDLVQGIIRGGNLTILSFLLTMAIVTGAMLLAGWGIYESLLLGAILGDLAQTVIIPLLKRATIDKSAALTLTLESALTDVLTIVAAVTILNIMVLDTFSVKEVVVRLMYSFAPAILIGIIGGFVWVRIHARMDKFSKSYITTIGALLLLYASVEYIGASGALACLAFGIIVGDSKEIFSFISKREDAGMESSEKFFHGEISFFVKSFFFVYLGLVINLKEPSLILLGFLLTVLVFLVRPIAVSLTHRHVPLDDKSRLYLQLMIPKGVSAAVLAMLPLQYGTPHAQQFSTIVLAVIAFSILFSITASYLIEKGWLHGKRAAAPAAASKMAAAAK